MIWVVHAPANESGHVMDAAKSNREIIIDTHTPLQDTHQRKRQFESLFLWGMPHPPFKQNLKSWMPTTQQLPKLSERLERFWHALQDPVITAGVSRGWGYARYA